MTRRFLLLLSLPLASGVFACSDRDPSTGIQDRTARVRFVNATADAATLTARVENVDRATVGLGASSACITVESGVSDITFMQPGVSVAVASTVTSLVSGGRYVVLASGAASSGRVVVVETDASTPPAASTALRVVNATGTLGSVDVYVTGPDAPLAGPTQSGLAAHAVTPVFTVPAGPARLRVTAAGTTDVLLDTGAIEFPGGQFRVLVLAGSPQATYDHFLVDRCP